MVNVAKESIVKLFTLPPTLLFCFNLAIDIPLLIIDFTIESLLIWDQILRVSRCLLFYYWLWDNMEYKSVDFQTICFISLDLQTKCFVN